MRKQTRLGLMILALYASAAPAAYATDIAIQKPTDQTGSITSTVQDVLGKIKEISQPQADLALAIEHQIAELSKTHDDNETFDALSQFYKTRSHQGVWFSSAQPSARTLKVLARLGSTEFDGLPLEGVKISLPAQSVDTQALAKLEIETSYQVLRLAKMLHSGRVNPYSLGKLVTPIVNRLDLTNAISKIALSSDPTTTLDEFAPQHPQYKGLKAALAKEITSNGYTNEAIALAANMERWRWLPADMGKSYVLVNIPQFELDVFKDNKSIYNSRVVVGKPQTQTPIFSDMMEMLVVNPYWHVPTSIAVKEYLPKLQKDPNYLSRIGIEIVDRRGRVMSPNTADWSTGLKGASFRQPPGNRNALGHIKFLFPNQHAVYLHDTSSRGLFQNSYRAFSHGCVRVMDPFALAEVVLSQQSGDWNKTKVKSMVGGPERTITLEHKLPVHIAYFTRTINANGEIDIFKDLYGYDKTVIAALSHKATYAKLEKIAAK